VCLRRPHRALEPQLQQLGNGPRLAHRRRQRRGLHERRRHARRFDRRREHRLDRCLVFEQLEQQREHIVAVFLEQQR